MPGFTGNQAAHTPSTSTDNYTLDADAAGDNARIRWIGWGGERTSSTAYRTRWVRPTTAATSTFTAIGTEVQNPGFGTALCRFGTFATAAVIPAAPDALYTTSWNAHGGLGMIVLPQGMEWIIINGLLQGQLSCRNDVGTDASGSSYSLGWEE